MTFIKICGLTNLEDAVCAVDNGADLLGFIFFARSPRYVAPELVRSILAGLGARRTRIRAVGVFVNEPPRAILTTLETVGLDLAQLSGDEPLSDLTALAGCAYKVVRSRAQVYTYLAPQASSGSNTVRPDILLDADHPSLYGGSGQRADPSLAVTMAWECRLLLAGGLTPENIAAAVHIVRPWGVDVASGVEASPGRKDPAKISRFIAEVRAADKAV